MRYMIEEMRKIEKKEEAEFVVEMKEKKGGCLTR